MGFHLTVTTTRTTGAQNDETAIDLTGHTVTRCCIRLDDFTEKRPFLSGKVSGIELTGRVNVYDRSGEILSMKNLSAWAKCSAYEEECYRDFVLEVSDVNGNVCEALHFKQAFVVSYRESMESKKGTGEFYILIRALDDAEKLLNQ